MSVKGAQRALVRALGGGAVIVVALYCAWTYLTPFLIAAVLAAIIDPVVGSLQRAVRIRRGAAVTLVLSVVLAALVGLAAFIVANLTAELERLLTDVPLLAARVASALEVAVERLDRWFAGLPHPLDDALAPTVDQVAQAATAAVRAAMGAVRGAPNFLFLVMVAGLATYFVSRDRHALWSAVLDAVPRAWRPQVVRLRDEVFGGVLGLLRAQLCLVAVSGGATVVGLLLAGGPHSWLLGLAAGALELVPMIGPGGVLVPLALVYLLQGHWTTATAVAVLWVALLLGRQWLEPYVLGAQLGLHPLPTLVAVYAAVQLTGAAGFALGPLALVVLKAFWLVSGWPAGWDRRGGH